MTRLVSHLTNHRGRRIIPMTRLVPFLAYVVVFHLAWIAWPYVAYPRLVAGGWTVDTN